MSYRKKSIDCRKNVIFFFFFTSGFLMGRGPVTFEPYHLFYPLMHTPFLLGLWTAAGRRGSIRHCFCNFCTAFFLFFGCFSVHATPRMMDRRVVSGSRHRRVSYAETVKFMRGKRTASQTVVCCKFGYS